MYFLFHTSYTGGVGDTENSSVAASVLVERMKRMIDIHWNGFIEQCYNSYPEECCAFLFARKPFSNSEEWFVFPVTNVAEDKRKGWVPDKKELQKVKKKAKEMGLTRIGNIHSHPLPEGANADENIIEFMRHPSEIDLKYARRHNDIIRGILVVDNERVYAHMFHDQFGEPIDIYVYGINHRDTEEIWGEK